MEIKTNAIRLYLCAVLVIIMTTDLVDSARRHKKNQSKRHDKRQTGYLEIYPSEIKEEFKNYARSYLNSIVQQMTKRAKTIEKLKKSKKCATCI
ncbi:uncharacterized protein LOC124439582 isoform X2 [Xenia sp. Carnegie-2017]|uniref:uncharacterized protein LOC124439582 isoform X2 n=1 Tax=Xenia sp. Carnegie-2017 TaxID=2897299 RepID=UPI001F04AF07|nr:uncharacterized protein LOC124439582 isoform X2 [Xenia sp. Carnegie-2017]